MPGSRRSIVVRTSGDSSATCAASSGHTVTGTARGGSGTGWDGRLVRGWEQGSGMTVHLQVTGRRAARANGGSAAAYGQVPPRVDEDGTGQALR